jgi:hypothetical protein
MKMPNKLQWYRAMTLLALILVSLSCAGASRNDGGASRNRNALGREDMVKVGATTLFDAVQRLRPHWLNTRGGSQSMGLPTGVVVFQGQTMLGEVDILKQFSVDAVVELRYLDGTTASSSLPGLQSRHVTGAIILVTDRSRRR